MKHFFLFLLCILAKNLNAQDGSNIRYYSAEHIDESLIGELCHVDFGTKSFLNQDRDTTTINVNGQLIKFYEHRVDNGYNNWFNQQYLVGISDNEPATIRLQDSRIDSLTTDKIYLTSILGYYTPNNHAIDTITVFQHSFELSDIATLLIKAKN